MSRISTAPNSGDRSTYNPQFEISADQRAVRFWHKTNMARDRSDVRSRPKSGRLETGPGASCLRVHNLVAAADAQGSQRSRLPIVSANGCSVNATTPRLTAGSSLRRG